MVVNKLAKFFFQGLLIVVPLAVTGYVIWILVRTIDGLLGLPIPGLGLLVTLLIIVLIGFLGSNVIGRRFVALLESGVSRLPVVKLVYSSLRELTNAFVGERRGFEKPVLVQLDATSECRVFGFLTCETFEDPALHDAVAVYIPQSYNFAGNLIIVPRERVQPVAAQGAHVMAFIVSGGLAEKQKIRL